MPSFVYDPNKGIKSSGGGGFTVNSAIQGAHDSVSYGLNETDNLTTYGSTSITTTAATGTITLGDASRIGDTKFIVLADHGGNLTLSVTNHQGGDPTSFTGNGTGDCILLMWGGVQWYTVVNNGFA